MFIARRSAAAAILAVGLSTACVVAASFVYAQIHDHSAHNHNGHKQSDHDHTARDNGADSPIRTPEPVRIEHAHLHEQLEQAMDVGGRTGQAAARVRDALADHFEQEDRLVMPLLGLLQPLAEGRADEAMRPAIEMSRQVQRMLPTFMDEHRVIHEAVDQLESAAEAEGKAEAAAFAKSLRLHAQTEEQVLYPAAILVGRQVEALLAEAHQHEGMQP